MARENRQRHFLRDAGWLPLALAAKRHRGARSIAGSPSSATTASFSANHSLVMADRERVGREASPSGAIIVKTPRLVAPAATMIKGRKRHALVDTDGRGLVLEAHPAYSRTAMVAGRCCAPHAARFRSSRRSWPTAATPARRSPRRDRRRDRAQKPRSGRLRRPKRFFAWINRNRPLAKDFKATIASARAFLYTASLMLLVRRLARAATFETAS